MIERGMRVGPYEVIEPIGAGGMGEVYRARDTKLARDVALKILPEVFASDPDRLARFQREAQVLASLNHPHIAQIYGFEERALALEFVDGPTLADRIAQGGLPLDEALPIALQIADALEAAHAQGIIHRDLKPANIKLRPDGTVKVLDFGLAKALDPVTSNTGLGPSISPTITAATQLGMILGTAAYMSPEQAKGKPVDKRSDNWAFGCVLYEMLTGQRAFPGDDITEVLAFVITKEPDWNALPATMPPAIHRLLRRCLQKDRKQRLADIADARLELEEARLQPAAAAHQATATTLRDKWATIVPWVIAAAALIALGVLAGPWRRPAVASRPSVARFSLPVPVGPQMGVIAGRSVLGVSNNGDTIAYGFSNQLYLRRLAEATFQRVYEGEFGLTHPVFSPDGRQLAFHVGGAVRRMEVAGGAAVQVCALELPFGMSWHGSGILVGQGAKGIVRCAPAGGGTPETLARVDEGEEAHGPQILPGDDALLFTIAKTADGISRWDKARVVMQSLKSGERKTLVEGGSDARYVSTGHLLYALGGTVFALALDPDRGEPSGGPLPVLEGVRRTLGGTTGVAQVAVSDAGTVVYVPGPPGVLSSSRVLGIADRAGNLTQLNVAPGPYAHVRVSRDGTHLAVGSDDGNEANVWIYRLDGTRAIQRLTVQDRNRFPIWSPDGQRVAFQSNREGDLAIFSQRADGAGAPERLTKAASDEEHIPESWSPDGKHLLFSIAKNRQYTLSVLALANKSVEPFIGATSGEPLGANFSPNGRWVVYSAEARAGPGASGGGRSPNRGVYVQPFPPNGSIYPAPRQSMDFHPLWSASGTEIIFVPTAASGQLAAVPIGNSTTMAFGLPVTMPARVTGSRQSGQMRAHDILPDGRFVGVVPPNDSDTARPPSELRVVLNWFEELKQRVPPTR